MSDFFVKICGLMNLVDVDTAVSAGADAVGFILAPNSPRTLSSKHVPELIKDLPEHVESVAVFRNQPIKDVLDLARKASVTTIQLHGSESYEDLVCCKAAGFKTLRAFSALDYSGFSKRERELYAAERLLIDAAEPGTGKTFNSDLVNNKDLKGFWLLAGGLTPENVQRLRQQYLPTGVDVSSGVESSRGVKDPQLIRQFIAAARA